jgi:hypothetical protein
MPERVGILAKLVKGGRHEEKQTIQQPGFLIGKTSFRVPGNPNGQDRLARTEKKPDFSIDVG